MHSVLCMLSVLMCPHITYEINFYNVKLISLRYDGLFLFIVNFTYIVSTRFIEGREVQTDKTN